MAGPTTVSVLDAVEVLGDPAVPLGPVVAALDDEAFADVHVAEELLAAVGAEPGHELLILQPADDRLLNLLTCDFSVGETIQLAPRFGALFIIGGVLGDRFQFINTLSVTVRRILKRREIGGASVKGDPGGAGRVKSRASAIHLSARLRLTLGQDFLVHPKTNLSGPTQTLGRHGLRQYRRPALVAPRAVVLLIDLDLVEHFVERREKSLLTRFVRHVAFDFRENDRGHECIDVRPELALNSRSIDTCDRERLFIRRFDLAENKVKPAMN